MRQGDMSESGFTGFKDFRIPYSDYPLILIDLVGVIQLHTMSGTRFSPPP